MLNLPTNKTECSGTVYLAIRAGLIDAHINIGYGPSYGVDDQTLLSLKSGPVDISGYNAKLVAIRHQATAPLGDRYTWWEIKTIGPDAGRLHTDAETTVDEKCQQDYDAFLSTLRELGGCVVLGLNGIAFEGNNDLKPVRRNQGREVIGVREGGSPGAFWGPGCPEVDTWLAGGGYEGVLSLCPQMSRYYGEITQI